MQDPVNDNLIGFDIKEDTIVAYTQSIAGLELYQSLDVTV